MDARRDSRATPPGNRYGIPEVSFPTPNRDDLIIVQDLPIRDGNFHTLDYGSPHPTDTRARLVWQGPVKGSGTEKNWRVIYATERNAEDAYNASTQLNLGSAAHPTFIRTYIVPRDEYAPETTGSPLTSVVGLTLQATGTGYNENTTATLTGDGTGAAASVTVQNGHIVGITLTNAGTGYSSAPTVAFVGTGTGALAQSFVQPASAILVDEKTQPLDDPQLKGLFLSVTRVYETLPGPIIQSFTFDRDRAGGAPTITTVQTIKPDPDNTTLPTLSDTVLDATIEGIDTLHSKVTIRTIIGSQPTLVDWVHDDRLGAYIKVEKKIVAAADVSPPTIADGVITEYKSIDEAISVRIVSTFPLESALSGLARSYPTTEEHAFPRMLKSAQWNVAYAISGGGHVAYDFGLNATYEDGYSGPCKATIYEYYTYNPVAKIASLAPALRDVTMFMPEAYTLHGGWVFFSSSQAIAQLQTFPVAESIHDTITIGLSGATGGGSGRYATTIPATTPTRTEFLAMTHMIKRITVDLYRGGICLVRVTQIDIPHV